MVYMQGHGAGNMQIENLIIKHRYEKYGHKNHK